VGITVNFYSKTTPSMRIITSGGASAVVEFTQSNPHTHYLTYYCPLCVQG
jgi:hypothetical protein